MNRKAMIRALAKHALAKEGARQDSSWRLYDPLEEPHIELPAASWGTFFEVDDRGDGPFGCFPVRADVLEQHREAHPVIRQADMMERDGHAYMEVPLEAGLPVDFLEKLIDEAYELVREKLDADDRVQVELAGMPYDEPKLLNRLIDIHRLKDQKKAIRKLVRPAVLLLTRKSSEAKIPTGATKIGGRPDLPASVEWPAYQDGKPLAFLAQINLAEIAKVGSPIKGLPARGLLSIFSAWGWMVEDDFDPQTPEEGWQEQEGWTVVLHTPPRSRLQRRKAPRGVNAFKAAAVKPTPILSLPNHRVEPPLAALRWRANLYERFDEMQSDFRTLQTGHWLGIGDEGGGHQLGGYALFQQEYPEDLLGTGRAMLLQIGSDGNTGMHWSDGGELTFYADARALARGRFERLWGTCQGG